MSSQSSITLPSASDPTPHSICSVRRATQDDLTCAFELVNEYFQAVDVWVRDTQSEFSDYLLGDDSGVWLAFAGKEVMIRLLLKNEADCLIRQHKAA